MNRTLANGIRWKQVEEETISLFCKYLQIDTTNPPGNELKAAEYFGEILDREGIPYRLMEPEPGRTSIMATLSGNGEKKPIILMNHMDVVPAEVESWDYPPFQARQVDGYIYARGAQDMKSLGILEFMTLLLLKRQGVKLCRDVIFLGCADEEKGGAMGIGHVMKEVPELAGAAFCLNEGGGIMDMGDGRLLYRVGFTEKIPAWFRITAHGKPGHGSVPHHEHCNMALVEAIRRILQWQPAPEVTPVVRRYLKSVATFCDEPLRGILSDPDVSIKDPEKMKTLYQLSPSYTALLRDTMALNIIHSGSKINVIPSTGYCEFDTRILPGHSPGEFISRVEKILEDLPVKVELQDASRPVAENVIESEDSEFYQALQETAQEMTPGAVVTPYVMTGASDSQYLRCIGVPCYGFAPLILTGEERKRVHGHNERMSIGNMKFGVASLFRLMEKLTC